MRHNFTHFLHTGTGAPIGRWVAHAHAPGLVNVSPVCVLCVVLMLCGVFEGVRVRVCLSVSVYVSYVYEHEKVDEWIITKINQNTTQQKKTHHKVNSQIALLAREAALLFVLL